MNLPCAVIEDLLPAYYEESCSQESRQAVKAHLKTCRRCQRILSALQQELPIQKRDEPPLASVEKARKKRKTMDLFHGVVVTLLVMGAMIPLLAYLHYCVTIPAPILHFEAREVSVLSDGRITFQLWADDPQYLESILYEPAEDGSVYVSPKCRIFRSIGQPTWSQYYPVALDADVTAIYVGTPRKNFLVWKQGQPLPPASKTTEAEVGPIFSPP